jgi:hypothetical protein
LFFKGIQGYAGPLRLYHLPSNGVAVPVQEVEVVVVELVVVVCEVEVVEELTEVVVVVAVVLAMDDVSLDVVGITLFVKVLVEELVRDEDSDDCEEVEPLARLEVLTNTK